MTKVDASINNKAKKYACSLNIIDL